MEKNVVDDAAEEVINSFLNDMASFEKTPLVTELTEQLAGIAYDRTEAYMTFTDALAASLGAGAANPCADEADQDSAITRCESFVSDAVSSSPESLVAALIASEGTERAREIVYQVLAQSPTSNAPGLDRG
jgi:hypothetical protein